MTDWQQRVVDEKDQLDERCAKVLKFIRHINFESLDVVDKSLLKDQYNVMTKYSNLLAERISRFST